MNDLFEPSPRGAAASSWDFARLELAERTADGGSLRLAADLCHAMLSDDTVRRCLTLRAFALAATAPTFAPGGDRRRAARVVRALEAEEDYWAMFPCAELGRLAAWGALLGVGLARNIWTDLPTGRYVPVLDPWHARHLSYDEHARVWRVATAGGRVVDVRPGDPGWTLYRPAGATSPWAWGAWRAVARWWLLKRYAQADWAVHGERARGLLAATPPAPAGGGADTDQRRALREKLAQQLHDLGQSAGLVLPAGWSLALFQAAANTFATYERQTVVADAGIAVALCGANLSTQHTDGGSRAATETHLRVEDTVKAADAEALAACLHDGPLAHWADVNFHDPSLAPWPAWNVKPPEDVAKKTAAWGAAADAATKWRALLGDDAVDLAEIARQVGLPTTTRTEH